MLRSRTKLVAIDCETTTLTRYVGRERTHERVHVNVEPGTTRQALEHLIELFRCDPVVAFMQHSEDTGVAPPQAA